MFRSLFRRLISLLTGAPRGDAELELRSENQGLRLELNEKTEALSSSHKETERLRDKCRQAAEEGAQERLAELAEDLATPTTQLIRQRHIIEVQGKDVPGADVMRLAKRLISSLEKFEIEAEGVPGAEVAFNPDLHRPMAADSQIPAGETVFIKQPGLRFSGRLLRPAYVTQKEG